MKTQILLVLAATICLSSVSLHGAELEPADVGDPAALYQIAVDDGRSEYDRRLAVSRLDAMTNDRDREVKAAAYFYFGRALIEGGTPEQQDERRGLRYLDRALDAESGEAAEYLARRIDPASSDEARARAIVLWSKAFHFGHPSALEQVNTLLPDNLELIQAHIESSDDRWQVREVASHLDIAFWKIAYAYPILVGNDAGGHEPSTQDREQALAVIEEAVALGSDDARYILARYLVKNNIDATRGRQLWEQAARNGHEESRNALVQIEHPVGDTVELTGSPSQSDLPAEVDAVPRQADSSTSDPIDSSRPMIEAKKSAIMAAVLAACLLTLVVTIFSSTGRVHMYLNSADVGVCALVCGSGLLALAVNPSSKHPIPALYYVGLSVAAASAVAALVMGWFANRGYTRTIIIYVPKLLFSWVVLLLGSIAFGASLATVQNVRKGEVRKAVKMAGVTAASGAGFYCLIKFISKLMPSQNRGNPRSATSQDSLTDTLAYHPLISSLSDPDPSIRRSAAIALGDLGDKRAIEALMLVANDENSAVRRAAAQSIDKLQ